MHNTHSNPAYYAFVCLIGKNMIRPVMNNRVYIAEFAAVLHLGVLALIALFHSPLSF